MRLSLFLGLTAWLPGLCAQTETARLVLGGLDAVEMVRGNEVPGSADLEATYAGFVYRFAREEHRDAFEQSPDRYAVQWGGACGGMGPLSGAGDPDRYWLWHGKIWLFASDGCRAGFLQQPAAHLEQPSPALEANAAGRAALQRIVAAVGGAAAIDGMRALREVEARQVEQAGEKQRLERRFTLDLAGHRVCKETRWDGQVWAHVDTPEVGFARAPGAPVRDLVPSQRAELQRLVAHHLMGLLRARGRDDFAAAAVDDAAAAEQSLAAVDLQLGTRRTRLWYEPESGVVRCLRYPERARGGALEAVALWCDDWREVGPLRWPFGYGQELVADGATVRRWQLERVLVDPVLEQGLFER